uniref:Large ribosomal subunit protein bL32c n=1 Tax=Zantedeschia aethiopica TaxID=69721 RepID=A0A3Q9VHA4_ZANAE|nr:ribosomal protein L32 [Zantedeschia aethiopica]
MAVPKKRTSMSKKRIRKSIWKKKGYLAALKALSIAKLLSTGFSNSLTKSMSKTHINSIYVRHKPIIIRFWPTPD